jgi:hypothetical protein
MSCPTVFFGLQYILKKWLEGVVLTQEMIDEAAALFQAHIMGPPTIFNREGKNLRTTSGALPPSSIGRREPHQEPSHHLH